MAVLSFVTIRQLIRKLFGSDPPTQIFQFSSCCSQINHWSLFILVMLQSQEEDRVRTSSAGCGGSPVHLAAHFLRPAHRPGLQEQTTNGLVKHQYQFNESSLYTLIVRSRQSYSCAWVPRLTVYEAGEGKFPHILTLHSYWWGMYSVALQRSWSSVADWTRGWIGLIVCLDTVISKIKPLSLPTIETRSISSSSNRFAEELSYINCKTKIA
jgi:hypothetical protein